MNEINLKLKSYDELIFEITTLNTNKYLLEQKVNKQKEVIDKIKEYINGRIQTLTVSVDNKAKDEYFNNKCIGGVQELKNINKLLEEIE